MSKDLRRIIELKTIQRNSNQGGSVMMRERKESINGKSIYQFIGFILILIIALGGICFTNSQAMFYNAIIMPCVGILSVIILGKKYYWIPISTAVLSCIVLVIQNIIESMEWAESLSEILIMPIILTIIYTILVSIGVGIGLLFKYTFSKKSEVTKSKLRRIMAGILCILLSSIIVWSANDLLGNPISAIQATREAKVYVRKQYPHLELEASMATYNFKFHTYMVNLSSPSSVDTHFYIECRNGKVIYDSYQSSVEEKWNTMQRLEEICTSDVLKLLEQVPGLKNNTTIVTFREEDMKDIDAGENDSIWIDMPYDQSLTEQMRVIIRCEIEDTSLENIARIFEASYQILHQEGYKFKSYELFSETKETLVMIDNVAPESIISGKLLEELKEASQKEEGIEGQISVVIREH